jgi:multiple sugar transport system permease protein
MPTNTSAAKERRRVLTGLAFLTPNILGVATFVIIPVIFSLFMAFSNWDLTQQNMFKPDAHVKFVGIDNFVELVTGELFFRFLGNTLFFMMGIPVAVGSSLLAAILLSKDTRVGGGRAYVWLITGTLLIAACVLLTALGLGGTAMTMLLVCVASGVLLMGITGGLTFYRTLFYTPHFVAGVATYILWKQLYAAKTGPLNVGLQPVLTSLGQAINHTPPYLSALYPALAVGLAGLMLLILFRTLGMLRKMAVDGELGLGAAVPALVVLLLPAAIAALWSPMAGRGRYLLLAALMCYAYHLARYSKAADKFPAPKRSEGFGTAFILALLAMVLQFILLGLTPVAANLPAMAAAGLEPPSWLNNPNWAKPALMVMGLWAAIGSNNMLLYLAALTNVPGELYEAADIDGAKPLQRFWNVTWPQLAPTTFFILVMAIIGGLQGGFEMARVMTQGGPAGATTTLAYFIYTEGFETGRLGYASAVAWTLFALIFSVTLFNWKFGNKYVND